jgi:hypothetical protein
MTSDPNKKTTRTFQCREALWQKFEQMARELECSVDYLINDSMKQYARQRGYGASAASTQSIPPPMVSAAPPPPPSSNPVAPSHAPTPVPPPPLVAPPPPAATHAAPARRSRQAYRGESRSSTSGASAPGWSRRAQSASAAPACAVAQHSAAAGWRKARSAAGARSSR